MWSRNLIPRLDVAQSSKVLVLTNDDDDDDEDDDDDDDMNCLKLTTFASWGYG